MIRRTGDHPSPPRGAQRQRQGLTPPPHRETVSMSRRAVPRWSSEENTRGRLPPLVVSRNDGIHGRRHEACPDGSPGTGNLSRNLSRTARIQGEPPSPKSTYPHGREPTAPTFAGLLIPKVLGSSPRRPIRGNWSWSCLALMDTLIRSLPLATRRWASSGSAAGTFGSRATIRASASLLTIRQSATTSGASPTSTRPSPTRIQKPRLPLPSAADVLGGW